jgi:hypothetical protein
MADSHELATTQIETKVEVVVPSLLLSATLASVLNLLLPPQVRSSQLRRLAVTGNCCRCVFAAVPHVQASSSSLISILALLCDVRILLGPIQLRMRNGKRLLADCVS